MKTFSKILDFFRLEELPVPPDAYQLTEEFAEKILASQSQGSVSLGDGRLNTKNKKDELYNSLKDYNFIS